MLKAVNALDWRENILEDIHDFRFSYILCDKAVKKQDERDWLFDHKWDNDFRSAILPFSIEYGIRSQPWEHHRFEKKPDFNEVVFNFNHNTSDSYSRVEDILGDSGDPVETIRSINDLMTVMLAVGRSQHPQSSGEIILDNGSVIWSYNKRWEPTISKVFSID